MHIKDCWAGSGSQSQSDYHWGFSLLADFFLIWQWSVGMIRPAGIESNEKYSFWWSPNDLSTSSRKRVPKWL